MKRVLISFVVIAAVALMASSQVQLNVTQVGDFNKLSLVDDINVNYRCNPDSAGYILLTCTKELADHVIFTYSSSGRLSIQVDDDLERMRDLPTITVYSKSLDEADNAGDSTDGQFHYTVVIKTPSDFPIDDIVQFFANDARIIRFSVIPNV